MVQKLLHRYWDIPDGTECHRKTYASTSISGAVGERQPARPHGQRLQGGHSVTGGCPKVSWGAGESRGVAYGCWGVWVVRECWGALVRDRLWGVRLIRRTEGGHRVSGSSSRGSHGGGESRGAALGCRPGVRGGVWGSRGVRQGHYRDQRAWGDETFQPGNLILLGDYGLLLGYLRRV